MYGGERFRETKNYLVARIEAGMYAFRKPLFSKCRKKNCRLSFSSSLQIGPDLNHREYSRSSPLLVFFACSRIMILPKSAFGYGKTRRCCQNREAPVPLPFLARFWHFAVLRFLDPTGLLATTTASRYRTLPFDPGRDAASICHLRNCTILHP